MSVTAPEFLKQAESLSPEGREAIMRSWGYDVSRVREYAPVEEISRLMRQRADEWKKHPEDSMPIAKFERKLEAEFGPFDV